MPDYRRNLIPGATYFFTVNLADRRSNLLVAEVDHLRAAVARTRTLHPFTIDAWVVLPDHMHAVWTLPVHDTDFSTRWATIKRLFSTSVPPTEHRSASRRKQGERGIWQRRFWEHTIRDARDFAAHVDYVHFNPVKHGLVTQPAAWPLSSFRRSVARGHYPSDWAGAEHPDADMGERTHNNAPPKADNAYSAYARR
jgi:putative transposase